jgi:hypothetical protein
MQDQTWELISAVIWQRLGRYDGSRSSHNTSIHIPKNNRSRMNQRCQEFVFWERSVVLNPMLRFDFHAQKSDCDCTWHILFDAWSYPQDEVFLNKESAADDLLQEQKALWAWPWSLWVCSSFFFKQSTAIPNFFFLHSDNFSMAVTWLWVTSLLDTHVTYPFLDSFVQSNSLFWLWLLKSPILDQWPSKSGSKIIPTRWAP